MMDYTLRPCEDQARGSAIVPTGTRLSSPEQPLAAVLYSAEASGNLHSKRFASRFADEASSFADLRGLTLPREWTAGSAGTKCTWDAVL